MQQAQPDQPSEPAEHVWFSKALLDVGAERRRQIEAEGFDYQHDDRYRDGQLERAGAAYALLRCRTWTTERWFIGDVWPFTGKWFKPRSHRENLVRAAAFLIAAIERLDRAEPRP